jgi:hypothetical protein
MTIYYLMIKTHNITGLKYLCQTKQKDPFIYTGSGVFWKSHLKKHGVNISTTILLETTDRNKLKELGRAYSKFYNVVRSKEWANKIPETGGGPGWKCGDGSHTKSEKFRKFISESQKGSDNPKFDSTIYTFKHKETNAIKKMTRHDFITLTGAFHSNVSDLINPKGKQKSVKGWILIR